MTILAFYPVNNDMGWERYAFEGMIDEDSFRALWKNRMKAGVCFYDIESHAYDDAYDLYEYFNNGDEFEQDYNAEYYDGGWWLKVLHIPSIFVKQIILETRK